MLQIPSNAMENEVQQEEKGGEEEEVTLIKSRDPHLACGEQPKRKRGAGPRIQFRTSLPFYLLGGRMEHPIPNTRTSPEVACRGRRSGDLIGVDDCGAHRGEKSRCCPRGPRGP